MAVTLPDAFFFRAGAVNVAVNTDLNLLLSAVKELSSNTSPASFFSNANGVTFGSNSNTVTASVAAGGGGTNFVFSNSNGVSFGTAGSTVTATVATNYAPPGAYLTTAMASNRGSDFVQATAAFHGTNASGTIASGAISVSVAPPTAGSVNFSAGTTSGNLTAVEFGDSNGVSFGLNAGTITATVKTDYQTSGNYLTTAMASNRGSDFVQATATIAGTSISGTVASNGLSLSVGPYLTTAALSQDSSKYAGTNAAITGGSITVNTSGVSINLPAYLTTAMGSGASTQFVQANATIAGTSISGTIASNGLSLSVGPYLTTAALSQDSSKYAGTNGAITGGSITVNTSGVSVNLPAYLTTAMASGESTQFVQANAAFAGTNASGTINSTGISVSVAAPGAGASINVSAGSISRNVSAITFADSNGVTWGLNTNSVLTATVKTDYQSSGAYLTTAMQSNAATISNIKVSAGGSSTNLSALTFSDSNGVSFGLSGSTITATVATNYQSSGAYLTTAMLSAASTQFVQANATIAGTNVSGTIASNVISLSVAASPAMQSYWNNVPLVLSALNGSLTFNSNTSVLCPIVVPYPISIGWMRFLASESVAANTTMATSNAATSFTIRDETGLFVVVYSYGGAGNLAYVTSASGSIGKRLIVSASASQWTMSYEHSYYVRGVSSQSSVATTVSTSNLSVSSDFWNNWTGSRYFDIPFALSLPEGAYWIAIGSTTAQTTAYSTRFSSIGPRVTLWAVSQFAGSAFNDVGAATLSSNAIRFGLGSISLVAQGTSSSLALANVSSIASGNYLPFEWIRTT